MAEETANICRVSQPKSTAQLENITEWLVDLCRPT